MDPNVALEYALNGDHEAIHDLREWLKNGGFGPRVESHPATDAWISGDRFGTVVAIGTKYFSVKMDRSGKVRKFPRQYILPIS